MQMSGAVGFLWVLQVLLLWSTVGCSSNSEEQLEALLATETLLIDELRDYIERLDEQLEEIRRETAAIEAIHIQVGDRVEEYMGNPLNVLTILKRFETVWPRLEQQANSTHNISVIDDRLRDSELVLPTEEDYEQALSNLLHLQSVYELEPASLSLGVVNGMKLGSAMSWSDCLEMAMKSDVGVAKFWLETALDKLPPATNATDHRSERVRGKVQILEAALNMEYRAGELSQALATADELLLLRPMNQNVQKAKDKIERALAKTTTQLPSGRGGQTPKSRTKNPKPKSAEQLLIEELCRGATQEATTGGRFTHCQLERSSPWSLLQPARVELLSSDPYIALHHDVLTLKQSDQLLELMDEEEMGKGASYQPLKFSMLAQKKLRGIHHQLGHVRGEKDLWEGRRHGHEHTTKPEEPVRGQYHQTRVMLNLQAPGMGGAVVFPQLELGVNVPRGALLHWRTRTTSVSASTSSSASEMDYRSRQAVCPVLLGVQVSAWTGLS
ncbi:prolyl 4-hydroxylase subunit alpha-2 isoform X1 [Drosophila pseudoobscura]|uniref:Prolyl 4-hydroxylase subunit alpha-2 isoform X1 n=1 Tax=Drosophila pseudoobscura pseudoobscura TaxID=46245 RepID=A0A6I8ULZ7_DROPS|nr:prolyl 4-hydroxylase subunit alpha-2 isoform X1 [Drosophila pseudoobscura]